MNKIFLPTIKILLKFLGMKLSYEQLETELSKTQELLKTALAQIALLQKEIEDLRDKLNKNSKNSSKPPSTDQKPNTPDLDKKNKKPHPGKHRALFPKDRIDKTVECFHARCPCCDSSAMNIGDVFHILHQVELPQIRVMVTEYILRKSTCKDCCQKFCLAHLIREFRNFSEKKNADGEIGKSVEKLLSLTCHVHKEYREERLRKKQRNQQIGKIRKKVEMQLYEGLANGSDKLSGLCDRLLKDFNKLWTFTKIDGMEPTNNLAERDLRKLVIWRKKSYGTSSERGKKFVERITTITQTVRKQGQNVVKYTQETVSRFFFKMSAPDLNPALSI